MLRGVRVMAVQAFPVELRRMRTTEKFQSRSEVLVTNQAQLILISGK